MVVRLSVLAVGSANLNVELVCDFLEGGLVGAQAGQVDVDRAAKSCAAVSGARSNVAKMVVMGELGNLLDGGCSSGKTLEHSTNVSTRLHGNDTELILLVDPDEESLGVVVEDATAGGPVAVETAGLEEAITLPKMQNNIQLNISAHEKRALVFFFNTR